MLTVYFITGAQNTVATSLMKGLLQLRFPEMTLLLQTASEREAIYEMKARCEQADVVMLVGNPDPIDQFCLGVAESMSCKLLCAGLPADKIYRALWQTVDTVIPEDHDVAAETIRQLEAWM